MALLKLFFEEWKKSNGNVAKCERRIIRWLQPTYWVGELQIWKFDTKSIQVFTEIWITQTESSAQTYILKFKIIQDIILSHYFLLYSFTKQVLKIHLFSPSKVSDSSKLMCPAACQTSALKSLTDIRHQRSPKMEPLTSIPTLPLLQASPFAILHSSKLSPNTVMRW